MKRSLVAFALCSALVVASGAAADKYKKGYVTKAGTYVAPHFQTAPNQTKLDNYSSKGNVNPYTGKKGSVDPYKPSKP